MPALTGQTIAEAQGAVRALLDHVLADSGLSSNEYVTLRVLTMRGPVDGLAGFLASQPQLGLDGEAAAGLVQGLRERGLVTDSITADGRKAFESAQEKVAATTARLYADIDEDDLTTTQLVLTTVIARAAELSGGVRS
jgi:DNA-binding MarR family transcriptional regulator